MSYTVKLLVVISYVLWASKDAEGVSQFDKVRVVITNKLKGHHDLTVHCKSGDDDLGDKHLTYDATYDFGFRVNFGETTLFFCSFAWQHQFHHQVVFDAHNSSCRACIWHISEDGPCQVDIATKPIKCYKWSD